MLVLLVASSQAQSQSASPWTIRMDRDKLTDRIARFALTPSRSAPVQHGQTVTTALVIKCGTAFQNGPTHPELLILFTALRGMWHIKHVETRFRFDEGPVRDYKLNFPGRAGTHVLMLPKFSDQDPIADLLGAQRLRVEVNLPHAGPTLLDFNVAHAAEAIHTLACQ
jgi:hypothetical protein